MNICRKCSHIHRNNIRIGFDPFPKCGCGVGVDDNSRICICDAPYTLDYWIEKEIEK